MGIEIFDKSYSKCCTFVMRKLQFFTNIWPVWFEGCGLGAGRGIWRQRIVCYFFFKSWICFKSRNPHKHSKVSYSIKEVTGVVLWATYPTSKGPKKPMITESADLSKEWYICGAPVPEWAVQIYSSLPLNVILQTKDISYLARQRWEDSGTNWWHKHRKNKNRGCF